MIHRTPWTVRRLAGVATALVTLCVLGSGGPVAEGRPLAERIPRASVGPTDKAPATRVVAVGDVHGAYEPFVRILAETGLVDEEATWIGGNSILVQTGDFLDRGVRVRDVMDLLMRLQHEAATAGGAVHVLLGNHEVMNIVRDVRMVSEEALATFAGDGAEKLQKEAYRSHEAVARRIGASWVRSSNRRKVVRDQWLREHPVGLIEYIDALGPEGEYGRWLRGLPVMVIAGETLFIHAGLAPSIAAWDLEDIDARVAKEIETFDQYVDLLRDRRLVTGADSLQEVYQAAAQRAGGVEWLSSSSNGDGAKILPELPPDGPAALSDGRERYEPLLRVTSWFLLEPEGPVWFRGLALWNEAELETLVPELLRKHWVRRIVSGHTPQVKRQISMRLDGRIFLIDTGMLKGVYDGQPAALEIVGERVDAVYVDGRENLVEPPPEPPVKPFGMTAAHAAGFVGLGFGPAARPETPQTSIPRRWYDRDGAELPFRTPEEVEEFLEHAEVVSVEKLDVGTNEPKRVLLEMNGTRVRAIFRYVDVKRERLRMRDGRFYRTFHDSAMFESAAYRLSQMLGLDLVPPVVDRRIEGDSGTLQLWLEGTFTEGERRDTDQRPPSMVRWLRHYQAMDVFDNLVRNDDRNTGNILIDRDWNMWMIDHTRCFQVTRELLDPSELDRIPRTMWAALRDLDRGEVTEAIGRYIDPEQITALFVRRDLVVEHYEALIQERGEDRVLYDLGG